MLLSVLDYPDSSGHPDIQAALDAADDGDRIYLPAGAYSRAVNASWTVTKSVEIYGDGPGRTGDTSGTSLQRTDSGSSPILAISPPQGSTEVGQVHIRGIKIVGPTPGTVPPPAAGPTALKCTLPTNGRIRSLRLDRVVVDAVIGPGLGLDASPGNLENVSMTSCYATHVLGLGVTVKNVGIVRLSRGGGGACSGGWLRAEASAVAMYVIECEGDGLGPASQGPMLLLSCSIAHVESCRYESFYNATIPTGLEFKNCGGAALALCNSFVKADLPVMATTGIKVSSASAGDNCPVTILSNNFIRIYGIDPTPGAMVDVTSSHQGCVVVPQFNDARATFAHASEIKLPGFPNKGLFAAPSIPSRNTLSLFAGLIIPSGPVLPASSVQNGILYFIQSADGEDLYVRINGAWRRVVVSG